MTDTVLTAVDANFNRAMEGLRVCEDALRFVVHAAPSVSFKEIRHRLASIMKDVPVRDLLAARDVEGDAQKFIDLATEKSRDSIPGLVRANIHRAIEAVRCLEEYAKMEFLSCRGLAGKSAAFQELRFELYKLEKTIILDVQRNEKARVFSNALYAILDSAFVDAGRFEETCRRLIKGGAAIIQLRMKKEPRGAVYRAARDLCRLCREEGRLFIINDYPDIAAAVGADGIHLGQDDLPLEAARRVLAPDQVIGVSTHSLEQAVAAAAQGPDYIALGPVFDTSSKYGEPIAGLGTGIIGKVREAVVLPLVCIGGITARNVSQVVAAGCTCPAVISDLYRDDRVEENCRAIMEQLR